MEFEFGTFLHLAPTKIAISASAIAALGTVGLAMWYRLRAGSGDAILDRVRRLVAAKHTISHDRLQTYLTERKDREYFRFMCRVSVNSMPQLDRVLAWIDRYEIGNDELAKCRFHIEPSSPKVLIPTPHWLTAVFIIFLAISSTGALFGAATAIAPLYIKITATNDWFTVSEDSARSLFTSNHTSILKTECSAPTASDGSHKPDPRDSTVLCDLLTNPAKADLLKDWGREQKWVGWGFFFFVGIFCYWNKVLLSSAFEARHLFNRMKKVDGSDNGGGTPAVPPVSPPPPAAPRTRKRKAPSRPKAEEGGGE